mgnify:CR=1 FL=1
MIGLLINRLKTSKWYLSIIQPLHFALQQNPIISQDIAQPFNLLIFMKPLFIDFLVDASVKVQSEPLKHAVEHVEEVDDQDKENGADEGIAHEVLGLNVEDEECVHH